MRTTLDFVKNNLTSVNEAIDAAAAKYGRDSNTIKLIAVSKKKSVAHILAARELGQRDFGESYVQEAIPKIEELCSRQICWHFIGPIQKNKTRLIAQNFDWVHSVDRLTVAQRLNDQRDDELGTLNICIQVNIDDEGTKSGITAKELPSIAATVESLPKLTLRGLMAIPARTSSFRQQQESFHKVKQLFVNMRTQGYAVDTLSMGMSSDLEAAISEGATMVRVGSAIFGSRE